jgi:hypothetical protein
VGVGGVDLATDSLRHDCFIRGEGADLASMRRPRFVISPA